MLTRRRLLASGVLAALAAACSSGPSTPYNSRQVNGDSLYYVHPSTYMPEVMQDAQGYCSGRGKSAVVQFQAAYGVNGLRQSQILCR